MDFRWLSWLFNFVEHARFVAGYARLEVVFDGSMIHSNDILCGFTSSSFGGFFFSIGRILALVLGFLLELSSHANRSFHEVCNFLLNPVEHAAVRSSYVEVGKESVPVARKTSE